MFIFFTATDVIIPPPTKTKDKSSVTGNLPSVPVYFNTVTPTPPKTEKPVKTAVPCRQLNLFSKESVQPPLQEGKQIKLTTTSQTHRTAGQDSAKRLTGSASQGPTLYKPYLMSVALQNSEKRGVRRFPVTRETAKRYPLERTGYAAVFNRPGSLRNPNLTNGLRKGSTAAENVDKKRVRFQQEPQ